MFVCCAMLAFAGPADGGWTAIGPAQGAPQTLSLQANGQTLSGTADGTPIVNGKIAGASVWFSVTRGGATYSYKGTVDGSRLNLHETRPDGSGHRTLEFTH